LSTLQEFGSRAKTFAPFGGSIWVGIKKADLFNPQEDCGDCIWFGVFEKQVVISTGDKVIFTLPNFIAQPPCMEIGVNCFETIVCPPTCDTVGNTAANSPQHHEREVNEGTPVLGEGKGNLDAPGG